MTSMAQKSSKFYIVQWNLISKFYINIDNCMPVTTYSASHNKELVQLLQTFTTDFFVHFYTFSCWIAVGAGDKGAIWAFVVPMLLVVLVRSL